ncbi:MAG: lytic transglycosylase domain-containing protein [Stappiaceae bacterium]
MIRTSSKLAVAGLFAIIISAQPAVSEDDDLRKPDTKKQTERLSKSSPKESKGDKLQTLVKKTAKKHGVPTELAHAVVTVESNYNPRSRGSAGEVGLMQIKPATARGMGYRGSTQALYKPETNLEWGMRYLAEARRRAGGDLCGTILRYNAGHYAKRMNPVSARYCKKIKRIIGGVA